MFSTCAVVFITTVTTTNRLPTLLSSTHGTGFKVFWQFFVFYLLNCAIAQSDSPTHRHRHSLSMIFTLRTFEIK